MDVRVIVRVSVALLASSGLYLISSRAAEAAQDRGAVPQSTSRVGDSRASAHAAYQNVLKPALAVPTEWTGSKVGCVAGAPSPQAQAATLTTVNFFREMAGLTPVTFNPSLSAMAQEAALMMHAQGALSHAPDPTWACYSSAGAAGAGASNLSLGRSSGAKAVADGYMTDPGANNTAVGHRRWILYPPQSSMGSGSTSNSNALYVFGGQTASATPPAWIPWPTSGYVPHQVEPRGRWSLSATGGNTSFSQAQVSVTSEGVPLPVTLHPVVSGYGNPTLVWQLNAGYGTGRPDRAYDVSVTNILQGGVPVSHSYTVTLFDGEISSDPPNAPTGVSATAGNGQATVSWSAPPPNGGFPAATYHVTSSPGGQTCSTSGATSCTVSGLSNGTTYSFTVAAANAYGPGPVSAASTGVAPSAGDAFHPLSPARILDSRGGVSSVGPYSTPWSSGLPRDVTVVGAGGVPSAADAVVLNVTVTGTTAAGYLTIWPAGQPQPLASSLNWAAGQTIPNAVTVKVGAGGRVSVLSPLGSADVIFDVVGYYDTLPGDGFTSLTPARILDSRSGASTVGPYSTPWGPNQTRDVTVAGVGGVPAGADAVVVNVTVTGTTAAGFLTIWPAGQPQPLASSLNWAPGQTIPNAVTVKVGAGGKVSVFNSLGNANVIVDVVGSFSPGTGQLFHPLSPTRIQDSRPGGPQVGPHGTPWGADMARDVQVTGAGGVPAGAGAVLMNVTATATTASGYLTVWPAGQVAPLASSLNWAAGDTIPNSVTAKLGTTGGISVKNAPGDVHVLADVAGWYG